MSLLSQLLLLLVTVCACKLGVAAEFKEGLGFIGELPPHVQFRDGQASYAIDYSAAQTGIVPLYVVNATDKTVKHALFPLVLREALGDDGIWRRCDPYSPPMCGHGLSDVVAIPPHGFYRTYRRLDSSKGTLRKVRFREYRWREEAGEITNAGEGLVDLEEMRRCRHDLISVETGSFQDLVELISENAGADLSEEVLDVALERFMNFAKEPRRVPVLKGLIRKAKADENQNLYRVALDALRIGSAPSWTRQDYWKFAQKELSSAKPTFAYATYCSMMDAPFFPEGKRALMEDIIANATHPLLKSALKDYPRIAGNARAIEMVQRVLGSRIYDVGIKQQARALQEVLLANPYLAVAVEPGEPDALGRKTVVISVINVSERPIALRAANPVDLLAMSATDLDGRELPRNKRPTPKVNSAPSVELEPRGLFKFPAVHWWDFIDVRQVPHDTGIELSVSVRTPGLWERPARSGPVDLPATSVNAARDFQRHSESKGSIDL